jgi:nitroreductase
VAVCVLPYESHADRLLADRGLSRAQQDRLRQRPDIQSVGAAVQLLVTAAHALGYGACWMSAPVLAAEGLEEALGVEPPARLVALVPMGRPAGRSGHSGRLPVDEVLRFL